MSKSLRIAKQSSEIIDTNTAHHLCDYEYGNLWHTRRGSRNVSKGWGWSNKGKKGDNVDIVVKCLLIIVISMLKHNNQTNVNFTTVSQLSLSSVFCLVSLYFISIFENKKRGGWVLQCTTYISHITTMNVASDTEIIHLV